ncbi:type III PLP-dependent enzyme [Paenibacillus athensensis]|nr:type III PLP-dependent enzyme [Paenibacillus athensensis]
MREAHEALRRALPEPSVVYYSLKANPHEALVQTLVGLGCHAEVSSTGELRAALDSGCLPQHVLYTGPGKTTAEIAFALRQGVIQFSVDSRHDMDKVLEEASRQRRQVRLVLRINPDEPVPDLPLTMTGVPSQFGFDASLLLEEGGAAQLDPGPWGAIVGFHIYMGTNLTTPESLLRMYAKTIELAHRLAAALRIELELLDLGGGFGHPFIKEGAPYDFSAIRGPLEANLEAYFPQWRQGRPAVAFESGRYLVGAAGTLYSTVQDVKMSKGQQFVILDAGIHHLGGMSGLGRLTRISAGLVKVSGDRTGAETATAVAGATGWTGPGGAARLPRPAPGTAQPSASEAMPKRQQLAAAGSPALHAEPPQESAAEVAGMLAHVVGPLCTPLDYLARNERVPLLEPGDIVAVPNAGAYGLTASLIGFLSRETPCELVVDEKGELSCSQLTLRRVKEEVRSYAR